jgi:hypothetical protein
MATNIVHAGEAKLATVVEGAAKVRNALPEGVREAADRTLGADTPFGKGVKAMAETIAEESARAREAASQAQAELAAARESTAAALEEKVLALTEASDERAAASHGPARRILVATVLAGAAAGGGWYLWRRRRAAAQEHLSGEGEWGGAPSHADEQSPETVDPELAAEIDAVADEMATAVVEAIEVDGEHGDEVAEAPAPAVAFVPGVADEQSPDVIDEQFAAEVDAEAQEIADSVVDAVEPPTPKKPKAPQE